MRSNKKAERKKDDEAEDTGIPGGPPFHSSSLSLSRFLSFFLKASGDNERETAGRYRHILRCMDPRDTGGDAETREKRTQTRFLLRDFPRREEEEKDSPAAIVTKGVVL